MDALPPSWSWSTSRCAVRSTGERIERGPGGWWVSADLPPARSAAALAIVVDARRGEGVLAEWTSTCSELAEGGSGGVEASRHVLIE